MGGRRKSRIRKAQERVLIDEKRRASKSLQLTHCPNCGKKFEIVNGRRESGHLVPPCFGDPAMWTCEKATA